MEGALRGAGFDQLSTRRPARPISAESVESAESGEGIFGNSLPSSPLRTPGVRSDKGLEDATGFREVDWENGHVFKGQWRDNKMHGKGKLVTPSGMYRGDFVMHKMHGFGRYDFHSGEIYIGEFENNVFNGHAVLGFNADSAYDGEFLDGKRNGLGTMLYENGDVYEGEWKDGKREGDGIYVAHNKTEVYHGQFRANKRHGAGELWMYGDPLDKKEEEHEHKEFPKWAVEYKDSMLVRKRSRPSSRPKWPSKRPAEAFIQARSIEIDDGARNKGEAMTNFDALELAGASAPGAKDKERTAIVRLDDDDDDDDDTGGGPAELLKTQSEDISRTGSASSEAENQQGGGESPVHFLQARQQSMEWDQVHEEAQKPPLLQRLFGPCLPKQIAPHQDQLHASAEFTGKVDSRLVIKVEKADNLPPIGDDCNPVVRVQSRGMARTTKEKKDTVDPIWKSTFEFEHSTLEESRRVTLTVSHSSGKVGHHLKFLGKVVLDLSSLTLGNYHPSRAFYLKGEHGKHTVFGRSEGDGKKPVSQIWISYYLMPPPDALLTVRILSAKELKSFDMRAVGAPFVVAKYMGQEKRTTAGHDAAHPKWNQSLNFEVHAENIHKSIKYRQIPRDTQIHLEIWDSMMLSHDTLMGVCTIDIHDVVFDKNAEAKWHVLSNPETTVSKLGSIHTSVSWGMNEVTALRFHVEEALNLTQYLGERSMQPKKIPIKDPYADADEQQPEEDDPELYKTLPDAYLRIWFDAKRSKKTQVIKEDINPQWNERFSFSCKRSELPSSIVIQCYHKRRAGADEFIGKVTVDITDLKLDDLALSRWLRLEDAELLGVQRDKQRKLDRAAKKAEHLKLFLAGKLPEGSSPDYFDDDEEEAEEEEAEEEEDAPEQTQSNKLFSRFMGTNSKASRKNGILNQLANGKNPAELGRIKLRVMWVSMEDDEDKECIRLWNQQMQNPACRKILKRVMKSWVHDLLEKHFQKLLRSMAIGKTQWNQAVTRYREKVMPRVFSAWGEKIQTGKVTGGMRQRNQNKNVLRPFWGLWMEVVEAGRKRDAIQGKARRTSTTSTEAKEDYASAILRPKMNFKGLLSGDFLAPSAPREVDEKFMRQLGRATPKNAARPSADEPASPTKRNSIGPGRRAPETPDFLKKQETFSMVKVAD